MGVVLSLVAALCYGSSDFIAGIGGRRGDTGAVALIAQPIGLLAAVVALLAAPAHAPSTAALWWGALSGVGSGIGTLALYRGLAVARMSVVAPLSGVLTAALPVVVGFLLGDRLSALSWIGVILAVPATLLVSLHPGARTATHTGRRVGIGYGLLAGAGFAVLFIGLAQAGSASGSWPLIPGQLVSVAIIAAYVVAKRPYPARSAWSRSARSGLAAGVLAGVANLSYLAATGSGQLAVIAVLTALYPAVTVLLARLIENERWERLQIAGMLGAVVAVVLISAG